MGRIVAVVEEKKRILQKLEQILSEESKARARTDHHSYRRPRPCGMTIHTGIGCSYGCRYCYIYDMGFPGKPEPYPLEPLELVYALTLNPYVAPGHTFAAYGSVTEPFLPETKDRALSYMVEVYKWLKLPSQLSTKSVLDDTVVEKLLEGDKNINILITIVTIAKYRELEGRAPPPQDRLVGASIAVKHGLKVTLFVRPIIPGITDREADKIFSLASQYGIDTAVLGTLRVTPGILKRLEGVVDINTIISRLPRMPRSRDDQVTIRGGDIKKRVEAIARDYGFKVFETACAANVWAHNEFCAMCDYGPCGDIRRAPQISENDVRDFLEYRGYRVKDIAVDDYRISIVVSGKRLDNSDVVLISSVTRRKVVV